MSVTHPISQTHSVPWEEEGPDLLLSSATSANGFVESIGCCCCCCWAFFGGVSKNNRSDAPPEAKGFMDGGGGADVPEEVGAERLSK